ncbi:MAG: baseplate J/gp47 family protein [Lachnospiraceae bacterium]|nr:baseplate J/gp47 family protein [Lachnospiraceae bacterium]MDE6251168.1 baseplate J/gp47 family protein [Lachnospiraceae bacterium]
MINKEILDKVCPIPDEEEEMNKIKSELEDKGFIINNFNKGGIFYLIIRIFVTIYIELKTLARTIINNSFWKHADKDWLEIKAADYGKSRKQAIKAQGYITVYRNRYQNALQISRGHMFKTLPDANGKELKFYVLETTVIAAGAASGKVLVEAEESGALYNISSGKITVSMIHLDGVERVTNEDDWLYLEGSDLEDIENFRERIGESWSELAELTTEDKLKNVARKINGVLDVKVDAQHPRGQGTTDIIITGTSGEATDELLRRVAAATGYLKGNYDDFLYKSSTVMKQDINIVIYIAREESTEGIKESAKYIIEEIMQLNRREELNCLYRDDIRYALRNGIANYKRSEFIEPEADIELEKDKVVMLNNLNVTVRNVGGL